MQLKPKCREEGFTLIELSVVLLILGNVLAIIMSFLISVDKAAVTAGARVSDDTAAKGVQTMLETQIRFAYNLAVPNSTTLDVATSSGSSCILWNVSGGNLTEESHGKTTTVASGVLALGSDPYFGIPSSSAGYDGLVSANLVIRQSGSSRTDVNGAPLSATFVAANMRSAVTTTAITGCGS